MDVNPGVLESWLLAAAVNLTLGTVAWRLGAVSRSGYLGGTVVGTLILAMGGWGAYLSLCTFFALGSGATRWGYRYKEQRGLAQDDGGRRGARHALANCGTGLGLAFLLPFVPGSWAAIGLVAAFATAASDTLSSEIGQLYGRRAYLPTSFRRVEPGTEGAVSIEGTLAGIVGSAVLALVGWAAGMYPIAAVVIVVGAAFVGSWVESLVGATWGGDARIGNETMNFLNTVVGAATAILLALAWG